MTFESTTRLVSLNQHRRKIPTQCGMRRWYIYVTHENPLYQKDNKFNVAAAHVGHFENRYAKCMRWNCLHKGLRNKKLTIVLSGKLGNFNFKTQERSQISWNMEPKYPLQTVAFDSKLCVNGSKTAPAFHAQIDKSFSNNNHHTRVYKKNW